MNDRNSSVRFVPFLIVAGTLLFYGTALAIGWSPKILIADDWLIQATLTHRPAVQFSLPFSLYSFFEPETNKLGIADGTLPWWTDEHVRIAFSRPLTSASLALNAWVFGADVQTFRIVNALLVGIAGWAVYAISLELVASRVVAGLSALCFVLSDVHQVPINWVACRHSLLCAAIGGWSLWAYLVHRKQKTQSKALLWASLLGWAITLLASESVIQFVPYILAIEIGFLGRPERASESKRWIVFWLVAGALLLFAIHGRAVYSGDYVDGLREPIRAIRRIGIGSLWASATLLTGVVQQVTEWRIVAFDVVLLGAAVLALWWATGELADRAQVRAFALSSIFAAAPALLGVATGTYLGGRLLTIAALGTSIWTALVVSRLWSRPRWGWRSVALLVFSPHIVFGPLVIMDTTFGTPGRWRPYERFIDAIAVPLPGGSGVTVALCSPEFTESALGAWNRAMRQVRGVDGHMAPLFAGPRNLILTRVERDRLRLVATSYKEPLPLDALVRDFSRSPLVPGDTVRTGYGTVQVVEATEGYPTAIDFMPPPGVSLDRVPTVTWDGARMAPVVLPPVGESVELPYKSGLVDPFRYVRSSESLLPWPLTR